MNRFVSAVVLAAFVHTAPVLAQLTSAPAAADTITASALTQTASDAGLSVTGYVEAYYAHDFTLANTAPERPGFLYNFRRNREVNVNLAFIKGAYVADAGAGHPVRANLAIQVGTYAQYNYAAEPDLLKNILEANAGVKLSKTKDLWLDAGIFASHIGFESAVGKDNWTLTRSLVAENSPYYLAGAKLTYGSANGNWTLLGSIVNGWQRIAKLPGYSGPSVSTQVQYRPAAKLTLNWSSFLGSDRPDSLKQGRFFNNFYVLINPAGRFGMTLGFDVGADNNARLINGQRRVNGRLIWYSPVVIARYKAGDRSYVAGRAEYYNDRNGVITGIGRSAETPNGFRTWGYSLGYDYVIVSTALFRMEGRIFNSKDAIFAGKRVNTALTTSLAVSF